MSGCGAKRANGVSVRLSLPAGWRESAEINEGQAVRVFQPPAPAPGVLRVLTDSIAAAGADSGALAVKMREVAVRFVRPDDARAYDRIIEDRPGGGVTAGAALIAEQEDGRRETHYLWMVAQPGRGAFIDAAMASLAMPMDDDGDPGAAAVAEIAEEAMRSAVLTRE